MELIFNISSIAEEEKYTNSKKDVLKYLKVIGVDTRFISYTPDKIFINNLRFSKFSRKRQETFNRQYPQIEVVRNSLFQKICSKTSKTLAGLKPNSVVLIPKDNFILNIILEPYTRKYGIKLVNSGEYDFKAVPITLDDEVNMIFSTIFRGESLKFDKKEDEVYPLINVSIGWINSFLEMNDYSQIAPINDDELACSFMEFLEDVAPQYRENVLKATHYIEEKNICSD